MGKLIAMLLGINSYIRAEIRVAVKELLLEEFTGSMTERDHWGGQQFLERTIDCKIERRTNEIIRDKVATATRFQREDFNQESFIDSVVDRIKNKQLN